MQPMKTALGLDTIQCLMVWDILDERERRRDRNLLTENRRARTQRVQPGRSVANRVQQSVAVLPSITD